VGTRKLISNKMAKIRQEISELYALGALPSEDGADPEHIGKYEDIIRIITSPVTNDEACLLVNLFGSDDCFGLASSLLHLIETAPGWPLKECLNNSDNEWIVELRNRAIRGGRY
jgi:hypothetical protein